MPRVAIAMPVYNDEQYLALALEGLCRQTDRDFALTVVDDGSTDASAAVAESFADRLPITVIRAEHRGLRTTKRAAVEASSPDAEFVLMHDADIELPDDAIERMVAMLDSDANVAAVSATARSVPSRRWGRGQAFFEYLVRHSLVNDRDESRGIVGGCVMLRRTALAGIRLRVDINEDVDLSLQLRNRFKLMWPRDLVADHWGVPTTLRGIWNRGYRDGLRVRAIMRVHPKDFQLGTVARLVPLPLSAAMAVGALTLQPWLVGGAATMLAAYTAAFLYASRHVPGDLGTRLEGTALFLLSNFGFAAGFVRESLSKRTDEELSEPPRTG